VQAVNDVASGAVSAAVQGRVPLAAPRDVLATPGKGNLTLSWTAPPGVVTAWRVWGANSTTAPPVLLAQLPPAARAFTETGLKNGAARFYRIAGVDEVAEGARAGPVLGRTLDRPGPVQDLAAATAARGIALSWSPPATDGGSPVTGHRVYKATSEAGPYAVAATLGPDARAWTDATMPAGAARWYKVEPFNDVAGGSYGPVVTARAG